jgi:hypothetical protein
MCHTDEDLAPFLDSFFNVSHGTYLLLNLKKFFSPGNFSLEIPVSLILNMQT